MKKLLSCIISITILLSSLGIANVSAFALNTGKCGECIYYSYDKYEKLLTLSGIGATYDYEEGTSPFYTNLDIVSVIIEEGVTEIGEYLFDNCLNLKNVTFPKSLEKINTCAFRATGIVDAFLYENVDFIGERAFNKCYSLDTVEIMNPACYIFNIVSVEINGEAQNPDDYLCIEKNTEIYAIEFCYADTMVKKYAQEHNMSFYAVGYSHPEDALNLVLTSKIDKTCTTNGEEKYESICSLCGRVDHYEEWDLHAQGHKYDDGKITQVATCLSSGIITYTCSECGTTIKESLPKLSHKYSTKTTKASLSKNGSIIKSCSVGNETSKTIIYYPKTITLSSTSYVYDGKVKTPKVTVVDSDGKTISSSNYSVTYTKGRKNIGRYEVKIKFNGNYSGTKVMTFDITPKKTNFTSVKSPNKLEIAAFWKKVKSISGYQIQLSKSSDFKSNVKTFDKPSSHENILFTKNPKSSFLQSKKKYYLRIRTYKKIKYNGKSVRIYSPWSKVKSVKVK